MDTLKGAEDKLDYNVAMTRDRIGGPRLDGWIAPATARSSIMVINALVYAEVSIDFGSIEDLEEALPTDLYAREPLPYEAAYLAGKSFLRYRQREGMKRSPPPDFYIGAHTAVSGYRLLTRDDPRYRTHYPNLDLIAPGV